MFVQRKFLWSKITFVEIVNKPRHLYYGGENSLINIFYRDNLLIIRNCFVVNFFIARIL